MTVKYKERLRGKRRSCRQAMVLLLGIAVAGGGLRPYGAVMAETSSIDGEEVLVRLVLDSISANYAQIHTAQLSVDETVRDASVQETTRSEFRTPSGGIASVTRTPFQFRKMDIWIDEEKVRVDRKQGNGSDAETEVYVFSDGVWTQYMGRTQAAWRRRPGEMPGMSPLDPRQYGAQDIKRDLAQVLQEDEILSAAMAKDKRGDSLVRIVAKAKKGIATTYEFSASTGYLPTRLITFWPDGSVLQVVDVAYQEVSERVWMPHRLAIRFYAEGASADAEGANWRQELVRKATGETIINRPIPDTQFAFEIPSGTQVSDTVKSAFYRTAALAPADQSSLLFWMTAIGTCVLLALTIYKHTYSLQHKGI